MELPEDLESVRIVGMPGSFYYIPSFISPEEATALESSIRSRKWIDLSRRRLQVHPSQLVKGEVLLSGAPLPTWLTEPLFSRFSQLGIFGNTPHAQANHVLVNNYRPGEGIMPHEDGPAYAPVTATVSLGGPTVLDIYLKPTAAGDVLQGRQAERVPGKGREQEQIPRWRILQEDRSLLVTLGDAYRDYVHGIAEQEEDVDLGEDSIANWSMLRERSLFETGTCKRHERISLTCRDVVRVSSLGSKLRLFNRYS